MEKIINLYDVIIIGSGPAGLTAGIYTSRANLKTLLIEGENFGGQLMTTTTVENYSGFNEINGDELISNMKTQAENNGCFFVSSNAVKINKIETNFEVIDSLGNNYKTKSIILAMGASPKKLNFTNSDKFWNKGISSCAVCDGALPYYRNKKIVVIGGGDTAMEEALYLSKFGSEITILVRSNKLRASSPMIKKVMNNKKINIKYNLEVIDAKPNDNNFLNKIIVKNNIDNTTNEIECAGLFYGIGHEPNTELIIVLK